MISGRLAFLVGAACVGAACGGRSSREGAGAAPPDGSADERGICAAIGVVDFHADCRASCVKNEPEPNGFCMTGTSIDACAELCLDATVDADRACASCIAEGISWPQSDMFCNDFECGCIPLQGTSPTFPSVSSEACANACTASAAYQRCLRETALVPPSDGTPPSVVAGLGTGVVLDEFDLDEQGGFLAIGSRGAEGPFVGRWFLDGTVAWTDSQPSDYWATGTSEKLVRVAPGTVATLVGQNFSSDEIATQILVYSADGVLRVVDAPGAYLLGSRPVDGIIRASSVELTKLDASLQPESSTLTFTSALRLLESRAGDFLAVAGQVGQCDGSSAYRFRVLEGEVVEVVWQDEAGSVAWKTLVESADGRVLIGGHSVARNDRQRPCCTTTCEPIVKALGPNGDLLWEFRPDDPDLIGKVTALASDAAGNVYAASTEDPVSLRSSASKSELCSVYGCAALVVRKLSPDGSLLAEYRHREAASAAKDIALDAGGRAFVLGVETREQTSSVLLGFDF